MRNKVIELVKTKKQKLQEEYNALKSKLLEERRISKAKLQEEREKMNAKCRNTLAKLLVEEKRLLTWKEELLKESRCIKEVKLKAQNVINLNVGGKRFSTSLTTLQCADAGSVLAAMFSGRYSLEKDASGYFFIDRDGTAFKYILNYLRDGANSIPVMKSPYAVQLVSREAKYYGLTRLANLLWRDSFEVGDVNRCPRYRWEVVRVKHSTG